MKLRHYNTLAEYDRAIERKAGHLDALQIADMALASELKSLAALTSSARDVRAENPNAEVRRRQDLERACRLLRDGMGQDDGYIDDIAHLWPTHGIVRTREELALLREEREALVADLAFDPNVTRPYRMVRQGQAKLFWHFGDGLRRIQVGDVVHLNERMARTHADQFELVEETPATASTDDTTATPTEEVPRTSS